MCGAADKDKYLLWQRLNLSFPWNYYGSCRESSQEYINLISQFTEPELYLATAVAEKLQRVGLLVKLTFLNLKLFSVQIN